jgi:glycerophosphoryl diester phosphodiesterase
MVVGLETDNWRRAQTAGVDGIMTEFPLECRRALHFRKP